MRYFKSFAVKIAMAALAISIGATAFAQDVINTLSKSGIRGVVSISRKPNGEVVSVTVKGEKRSYTLSEQKVIVENAGVYKITARDLAKFEKYENQEIRVGAVIIDGNKVVELTGPISPMSPEKKSKL